MSSLRARADDPGSTAPERRIDEVRAAAAAVFEQRGYSGTTMALIADEIGVLPGSLYHHFRSKEEIAVAILQRFEQDLGTASVKPARAADADPEQRLRLLMHEVVSLSLRNRAAVRLRVFEPPAVTTERLRDARRIHAPALEQAWRTTVDDLARDRPDRAGDARLLRFAVKSLALDAGAQFPDDPDPSSIAGLLADLLLTGVAAGCPDDEDLDRSDAVRAADDAMATWPRRPATTAGSDVRGRIIAAARTAFARHGFEAATIRDIAGLAEVRMATLYRRVESKEAILADVVAGFSTDLGRAVRAALTHGDCPAASLDALAKVLTRARRGFREESDIMRFGYALDSHAAPLRAYAAETDDRLRLLEGVLADGMARGSLRRLAEPQAAARQVRVCLWLPYQDFGRTSERRAHAFLRRTLLRGFVNG
ncbi:TetR family transcriptional regulator [Streptomyces sp. NPDC090306]|uniref:TetR family transcriptional regulator n=1 Tax=Streptomyces sp. NPDC090306 TaxID=3365961 RepID=UPI0038200F8F